MLGYSVSALMMNPLQTVELKLFGIVACEVRLLSRRFRSSCFLVNTVNNACLKQ